MKNFILGLVVGTLGTITMVALGWIQISSPRTQEVSASSMTVAINPPQTHREGPAGLVIDEKVISGNIAGLDPTAQKVSVKASGQASMLVDIQPDTRIRVLDREGTFKDLRLGQPVTAVYFVFEGKNHCRSLSVEK